MTEETPKEAIAIVPPVPKPEVTETIVKNSRGEGERQLARDRGGKFVALTKLRVEQSKNSAQKSLARVDEKTKKTKEELVTEHLLDTALQCGPKDLLGAVKALSHVQDRAFGKVSDAPEKQQEANHGVKVVMIPFPTLVHPEVMEDTPRPELRKPSWVDAEVVKEESNKLVNSEYVPPDPNHES